MIKRILSVDLGQSIDPTAIAVLEVISRRDMAKLDPKIVTMHDMDMAAAKYPGGLDATGRIDVRHLERLPLRLPYPAQVEIIAGMMRRAPLNGRAELVVDMTGVGRPVVDMFRRAGLHPKGVTITAGDTESHSGDDYRVSKLLLVSRLQAMLHAGELRIASKMTEAKTLANELQDFRATYSESTGYARFGAREGKHDDLVLAVAIGIWWASRRQPTVRPISISFGKKA